MIILERVNAVRSERRGFFQIQDLKTGMIVYLNFIGEAVELQRLEINCVWRGDSKDKVISFC